MKSRAGGRCASYVEIPTTEVSATEVVSCVAAHLGIRTRLLARVIIRRRIVRPLIVTAFRQTLLLVFVMAEELSGDHAADDRAGKAGHEAAGEHASKAHLSTAAKTAERALERTRPTHLGTRCHPCQAAGVVGFRRPGPLLVFGRIGAESFEHAAPLLGRELRERLLVRLLDGFRRRGLQQVSVAFNRLFVCELSRGPAASRSRCDPCVGCCSGAESFPNSLSKMPIAHDRWLED